MAKTKQQEQDVVDVLLTQHKEIRSLFGKVARASGADKRRLFDELVRMLAVHETAEEEIVHPRARDKIANGKRVIAARLKEEDSAKRALAELYDMGVEHQDFDVRLAGLETEVLAHAEKEESTEFVQLRQKLDDHELHRMAGAVKAAESLAPTRPHPGVGGSATANILAGPPLAIFDRTRDMVRDWRQSHREE